MQKIEIYSHRKVQDMEDSIIMFLQAKITIKTLKLTLDDFALFYLVFLKKIFKLKLDLFFQNL